MSPSVAAVAPALMVAILTLIAPLRAEGQGLRRGFLRLQSGSATLHASEPGSFGAVHLGRALDARGTRRWDLGVTTSKVDEGFLAITIGPEWRLTPDGAISPVLGVGLGWLGESNEFSGITGHLTGALDFAPAGSLGIRIGGEAGFHGRAAGPNLLFVAIEFRGKGIQ